VNGEIAMLATLRIATATMITCCVMVRSRSELWRANTEKLERAMGHIETVVGLPCPPSNEPR
jgi:hypothetical protein